MAYLMTRDRYRHQRRALGTALLFFVVVFALMLPGVGRRIEDVALAVVAACILATGYQLAALLMNGPDEI